jgi:hypothetical protein
MVYTSSPRLGAGSRVRTAGPFLVDGEIQDAVFQVILKRLIGCSSSQPVRLASVSAPSLRNCAARSGR